ncbi:hypothetical protein ACFFTM_08365 [Pseudoduganella plicata]|nr:hypothetical protein [Pseudoduganella plicata]QBQ38189.1 hypothetical protein E1742_19950 [Pseudoduganella plicata]
MKPPFRLLVIPFAALAVCACSPKFDWRDYRSNVAPYAVLFPSKPASHTRSVNLDGQTASMTMAATDIDGTLFAVGSAELADAEKAQMAVQAMKTAMVRNIGAAAAKESIRDGGFDVEAHGARARAPVTLHGRFLARGKRVYQVVVIGPENAVSKENVDTFLRSFRVN